MATNADVVASAISSTTATTTQITQASMYVKSSAQYCAVSMQLEQITTAAALGGLLDVARAEGTCAVDTEFVWERTYAPALCLVQLATATAARRDRPPGRRAARAGGGARWPTRRSRR